jgi:hypothetical protein
MVTVETIGRIRRAFLVDRKPICQIVRERGRLSGNPTQRRADRRPDLSVRASRSPPGAGAGAVRHAMRRRRLVASLRGSPIVVWQRRLRSGSGNTSTRAIHRSSLDAGAGMIARTGANTRPINSTGAKGPSPPGYGVLTAVGQAPPSMAVRAFVFLSPPEWGDACSLAGLCRRPAPLAHPLCCCQ